MSEEVLKTMKGHLFGVNQRVSSNDNKYWLFMLDEDKAQGNVYRYWSNEDTIDEGDLIEFQYTDNGEVKIVKKILNYTILKKKVSDKDKLKQEMIDLLTNELDFLNYAFGNPDEDIYERAEKHIQELKNKLEKLK